MRSPSTPAICPNPAARCDGEPPRDKWLRLLRGSPTELPQARGRSGFSALSTLPTTTARRREFTPTYLTRTPSVAIPCRPAPESPMQLGGRAVTASLERNCRADPAETRPALKGRLLHALAKEHTIGRTQGAFRHLVPSSPRRGSFRPLTNRQASTPDAFVSSSTPDLDRPKTSLARPPGALRGSESSSKR